MTMKTTLLTLLARCMPSKVILNNCIELIEREQIGIKKYGVTLEDAPLSHEQVLQHLLEEQLDAANYTRKALMTASRAHLDYALLRQELEKFVDSMRAPTYNCEDSPAYAARDAIEAQREQLRQLLHKFDANKVLRDLRGAT